MRRIVPIILCGILLSACVKGRLVEDVDTPGFAEGVPVAAGDTPSSGSGARPASHETAGEMQDGILASETVITAREFDTADAGQLPQTRACRRFLAISRKADEEGGIPYAQLVRRYDACLNSDRRHPTSRKLSCGNGRYYHLRRGTPVCA